MKADYWWRDWVNELSLNSTLFNNSIIYDSFLCRCKISSYLRESHSGIRCMSPVTCHTWNVLSSTCNQMRKISHSATCWNKHTWTWRTPSSPVISNIRNSEFPGHLLLFVIIGWKNNIYTWSQKRNIIKYNQSANEFYMNCQDFIKMHDLSPFCKLQYTIY